MRDPFKITEPTCISFSGGRTSAYMLWRVLQANTGKEDEATLRFVRRCASEWDIPITWIEFEDTEAGFRTVDFDTASRNGEPFEAIIRKRNYLPNPVARFCTVALKITPEREFLKWLGWTDWQNMVGIRADEPRRVAKIRANPSGGNAKIENGGRFRSDRPSYAQMAQFAAEQRRLFDEDESPVACYCGD